MAAVTRWLRGHVFLLLAAARTGWACEAPSSPRCFRRNADESVYICEWSLSTNDSDVTFDLYFNETKFGNIKRSWCQFNEEQLIKHRAVDIWVEAHVGNSSCTSPRWSAVLGHTVKYEAPRNISVSWLKNNLSLSWPAAKTCPALAEVWFRRDGHPAESWEKRLTNATSEALMYQVTVVNLLQRSAYRVQIRLQSTKARYPLWSDWSHVVLVPAELEHEPEVTNSTRLVNGTRKVTLTWKPMPHAAAVRGLTYSLQDTQSLRGCPCKKRHRDVHGDTNQYSVYVSHSAVNISVIATNAAGHSPPAVVHVPAAPAAALTVCDKTLLDENLTGTTCLEWFELQEADSTPTNVITVAARTRKRDRKQAKSRMKDYIRYLYFEHSCDGGKPHTVRMCLFYRKEGVPIRGPQDFTAFGETRRSANLSWKAIPYADQRGFLTNYSLCSVKIGSQDEPKECYNISASVMKYRLENLTPGTKYNISLAGATRVGEGAKATVTINTLPEKPFNVWWSFGLLFVFFFLSTMCTVVLKRIKNKIFPPVPTPVIPDFNSCQPESQEMLDRKEEVHELTLHQLHPEGKSVSEEAGGDTVLAGEWDDEDLENQRSDSGGSGDECSSPGSTDEALRGEITDLDQVDNELAMLTYRNGLM